VITGIASVLAALLLLAGGLLLIIAAWGVITLPDALTRQHAATKAGTLAVALVCLGAMLMAGEAAWTGRLAVIVVFLLVTLPVASHLLARAAVQEAGEQPWSRAVQTAQDGARLHKD
jgi:multicomponent Na+:H+ antiporter subunit G